MRKENKIKKKKAKKSKFWCMSCDRCLVGEGSKCPECGNIAGKKRDKKTSPYDFEEEY